MKRVRGEFDYVSGEAGDSTMEVAKRQHNFPSVEECESDMGNCCDDLRLHGDRKILL